MQEYGRLLKSDIEIYVGFFLVACIFIGRTNMIAVFSFWQMMRVRYMMSIQTQMAFSRLDQSTQVYLQHPYCPAMLLGVYMKAKGLLVGMVDT